MVTFKNKTKQNREFFLKEEPAIIQKTDTSDYIVIFQLQINEAAGIIMNI